MTESFPRQEARTRRFSLGVPRAFRVSPDGTRVVYLRTKGGTDPVTCLWVLDVATGQERLAADPRTLSPDRGGTGEEDLPPEERARRERVREQAGGIVAYATDRDVTVAAFALSGRVFTVPLTGDGRGRRPGQCGQADARAREVATRTPALDPRPDPAGRRLAYVCDGALRVADLAGRTGAGGDRVLADPRGAPGVTFGLPEFIAAEEMGRVRGYWWAPDGSALLVARVDETPVNRWHIADPAHPERAARRGGLSRGRHPQRRRVRAPGPARGPQRGGRGGPVRLPVPGDRLLAGRARPADRGAEPGPANHADPRRGRRPRPGHRAARGHRPALAGDRPRRAGLDRRRPDRVDPR